MPDGQGGLIGKADAHERLSFPLNAVAIGNNY
jgi:hypothetical protein